MSIPDYETLMLPLLELTSDGKEHSLDEAAQHLSDLFKLSSEEREQRIPSGQSTYIKNRTGWARTYLKKAGLLLSPKRGMVQITDRGRSVLAEKPVRIDKGLLERFPEFLDFQQKASKVASQDQNVPIASDRYTPEEVIERSYAELRSQLADELLDQIKECSPEFFERLVVDVIVAMGYGGNHRDAARATKRSNDGGIDGIIKQDKRNRPTSAVPDVSNFERLTAKDLRRSAASKASA